eukprot:CAMPEP_0195526792 /NCGR_PEP_ID=MMETSP0794_2-20130614/28080_1 /TAXON_ID=515487 /ORGANISM="Stephanopyxis turris, Strain CCMP 815" /LENGTH=307 /DNA_ID=CAMNT_0040657571 /DNA_START=280 /DNA_END=1203 /DNA_ORIENTATION=-
MVGLLIVPSLAVDGFDCKGVMWLFVDLFMCAINIGAAWYLMAMVTRERYSENPNSGLANKNTAYERAAYLLCYDPWIAVYILVAIAFVAWQAFGSGWIATGQMSVHESCPDNITTSVATAIGFGYAFLWVGACAFVCSLCGASCDKNEYGGQNPFARQQESLPGNNQQQTVQPPQKKASTPPVANNPTKPSRNDVEIPVATAVVYPTAPSAPPASAPPSAPPSSEYSDEPPATSPSSLYAAMGDDNDAAGELKAAAVGSAIGSKVGKLLKMDAKKQGDLEHKAAKAGVAVNSKVNAAKKYFGGDKKS